MRAKFIIVAHLKVQKTNKNATFPWQAQFFIGCILLAQHLIRL